MANNAEVLKAEQSLAHLLEFLARLEKETEVKKKVIKEIKRKVKAYTSNELDTFADEDATGGYLYKTIEKSNELRKNIVKQETQYKHYNTQFQDGDANKSSQHLIDNIFPLFGCLYYMYYECSDDCIIIDGGGEWHDERCDGKGIKGENLNQWLRDETGKTGRMIKRGFKQGELSNKTGNELFPSGSSTTALLYFKEGAQLQFCLYYMLFSPSKWNNAQSGHAVLFLQAFCEKVNKGEFFNVQYTEAEDGESFKTACQEVQQKISTLTGLNIIAPVAQSPTVNYKNLLEAKHFSKYIDWLEKNLEQLIKSLTEMKDDASNWDAGKLITSETFGPYPWGFTFKDPNWDQKKGQLQQQLKQQLSQLIEALSGLKNALPRASEAKTVSKSGTEEPSSSSVSTASTDSAEKPSASTVSTTSTTSNNSTNSTDSAKEPSNSADSNDSTNSTASTIGGVAGGVGAAAATAGAAYAGSSFLGPVAEGVGKFVRGLFF